MKKKTNHVGDLIDALALLDRKATKKKMTNVGDLIDALAPLDREAIICVRNGKDTPRNIELVVPTMWFKGSRNEYIPNRMVSRDPTHAYNVVQLEFGDNTCQTMRHYYKETLIDPSARKLIDWREMFKSYARSSGPQAVKKQSALAQYLPLIMIVLILAVGAYAYSSMQTLGQQMAIMQNTINAITK